MSELAEAFAKLLKEDEAASKRSFDEQLASLSTLEDEDVVALADTLAPELVSALSGASHTDSHSLRHATAAARLWAELFKREDVRNKHAERGTVEALVNTLAQANEAAAACQSSSPSDISVSIIVSARTHVLRAMGNMCYEHEANRETLQASGALPPLVHALEDMERFGDQLEPVDRLASAGIILNVAHTEELSKELVSAGIIASLLWLLRNQRSSLERIFALQALGRLASTAGAAPLIASEGGVPLLIEELKAASTMREVDGEQLDETDQQHPLANVTSLLREIVRSGKDEALDTFATETILATLLELAQNASGSVLRTAQTSAASCLAASLASDACVTLLGQADQGQLYDTVLDFFVSAMKGEDDELQASAAMGIGNLCRSDEAVRRLSAHAGLVDGLVALLSSTRSWVQHAVLGAVKNIMVLPDARPLFRTEATAEALINIINDPQPPLQYLACSAMRMLVSEAEAGFVQSVSENDGLISRLAHLTRSETEAVAAESTRLLVALFRFCGSSHIMQHMIDSEGLSAMLSAASRVSFPAVKYEVIIATAIVASVSPATRKAVVDAQFPAFASSLLAPQGQQQQQQQPVPPQVICNLITVMQLLAADDAACPASVREELHQHIEAQRDHESEIVATRAMQALAQLGEQPGK